MILIRPSAEIVYDTSYHTALKLVNQAASLCYNTAVKISIPEQEVRVRSLIMSEHESVIEHVSVTCLFAVDRGVTHELVRHRLCSFTQASTRYCDYSGEREGGHITFIIPAWAEGIEPGTYDPINKLPLIDDEAESLWLWQMADAEKVYHRLRMNGWTPEKARTVLPHSTATKIVCTANMRNWRHIMKLRAVGTTGRPHPQMVEVMAPLLAEFKEKYPAFFYDIKEL